MRYIAYQIVKHTAKAVGASGALAVGFSYAPVEPNFVSNFVRTKTPFRCGYDYEIGSLNIRAKGDLISGALGNEDMVSAVAKHAPDLHIVDINKLNEIITDPEYKSKIRANITISEKVLLGIPLIDLPINFTNNEGSAIPNSQEGFSETSDDSTDESTTPTIKKSPIKRRHSESLPRRSKKPVIARRNTR